MEKFVRDATLQSLESNNIRTNKQFGLIKGTLAMFPLLIFINEWIEILVKDEMVDIVYFDIQKAFSTVSHRQLIKQMTYNQIDDSVVTL